MQTKRNTADRFIPKTAENQMMATQNNSQGYGYALQDAQRHGPTPNTEVYTFHII